MECKPVLTNASSFALNVSMSGFSFAFNSSRKWRQMRAWPVSNASRYNYGLLLQQVGFTVISLLGIYRTGFVSFDSHNKTLGRVLHTSRRLFKGL